MQCKGEKEEEAHFKKGSDRVTLRTEDQASFFFFLIFAFFVCVSVFLFVPCCNLNVRKRACLKKISRDFSPHPSSFLRQSIITCTYISYHANPHIHLTSHSTIHIHRHPRTSSPVPLSGSLPPVASFLPSSTTIISSIEHHHIIIASNHAATRALAAEAAPTTPHLRGLPRKQEAKQCFPLLSDRHGALHHHHH